jgi:hypothetical protein
VDDPQSRYPRDLGQLRAGGYMEDMPLNPFTGQPMRCINDASEAQPGDFTYTLRFQGGGTGEPDGYTLAAYF